MALKIAIFLLLFSFSLKERPLSRVSLNWHLNPSSTLGIGHIKFHPVICRLTCEDICVGSQFCCPPSVLSCCLSRSSVCCHSYSCCCVVGDSQLRSLSWGKAIVSIECPEQDRPGRTSAAWAPLGAQEGVQFTETGRG